MKLAFLSSILEFPANANSACRLLLLFGAFLSIAPDFALHVPEEPTTTGENAVTATFLTCAITNITTSNISPCNNGGTNDIPEDDYFTADVTVTYSDRPAFSKLILTGRGTAEANYSSLGATSYTFNSVQMRAAAEPNQPIYLRAYFSTDLSCSFTKTNAGTAPVYCSTQAPLLCPIAGAHNGSYPTCWPPEGPNQPNCENSLSYAPDPAHPELTPLKYVRTVVHVFQKEDPNNPGQVNPNDPGNFTVQDIDIIKSFFDGPSGINDFLGNLCPAPDDYSPDMPDARFRLLNTGTPDYDVFFHPDNRGWGTSYYETVCSNGQTCIENNTPPFCNPDISTNCCYKDLGKNDLRDLYITGGSGGIGWSPNLSQSQINALSSNDIRNAYHVFLSGGKWKDCNGNNIPDPEPTDAYHFGRGGYTYTSSLNCVNNAPPPTPFALFYGIYNYYLSNPSQAAGLGVGFTGELYHVMGVDHIGPLRAHKRHVNGDDGCEDTPWGAEFGHGSSTNVLSCDFSGNPGTKCALTQCQLGKIHYFFERLNPAIQRFPEGPGPHMPVGEGTYGMVGNCDINMPDIVIADGVTEDWDWSRGLRSNVVVETGGRLYIRCRVGMPEDATITVEPGGRLYLYGEVYNNCDGQRWQGVVVEGNSGLPQTLSPSPDQGYFRMFNGSIIEGANTSIRIESGGTVLAIGANIRNSGGMLFEPYSFPQKGWFSGCNFTCDGNVYDFGSAPFKHAELHAVSNVRFMGCNFSVENVPAGQLSKMAGIVADGSMFRVTSGSTFRGFDTGINAAGQFSPVNAFTVNGCTFSNNQTGIFALGMQNFTVTDNTFEVGGADFQTNSPCGLMMDNCTGYTVEENTFYGTDDVATGRYGTMTQNSGDDANFIQGNSFHHLEWANYALGDNRGFLQGLQYLCNGNGDNPNDFYVAPIGDGIHINQGNGKATMNTFSHFAPGTDSDFHNEVGVIDYNYLMNNPTHEPNPNTPPGTGGINKIQVDNENTCPSDEPPCDFPCEYTAAEWQQTESDFNTARSNWQTEKASLMALMDGGDSGALLAEINGATSQNAGQVTQHLLNLSPWLSTQALTATINQKQVLTESATVQILNANPEGLREAEVRELVQASFSQTVGDGILANAGTQTARAAKENLVGQYRADMMRKADLLIQDILKDTTEIAVPLLRTWLANKESLEADYAIVASYLSEGDFVTASQKLDSIPLAYPLDAEGLAEHGYFSDLATLWQDAYTNGISMAKLDSQGISTVQSIATNSQRRAGAMAQGIFNTWYGGHYRVMPILPGGEGPQGMMVPPSGNSATPAAKYLSVFPNPARSSVYFHWNLPDGFENATISITDLQGKLLVVFEITGQKGKREWSVERLEHGIYTCHVKLPDGNTQTSKLAIIK
jgi:type IX secretion system substrate protein/copper-binding protein NosD